MEELERLIKSMLRANAEALNLVKAIADEVYFEFNEERGIELEGSGAGSNINAMEFYSGDTGSLSLLSDPEFGEGMLDGEPVEFYEIELTPWDASCHWGVSFYMWDAERTRSGVDDQDKLSKVLRSWTAKKAENPDMSVPIHYAVCASHNLQGALLTATYGENDEGSVLESIQSNHRLRLPGIKLLQRKGVMYLYIDWYMVGEVYIGIKEADTLEKFVTEREKACEVGLCEVAKASTLDKRFQRGVVLNLSEIVSM